MLFTSIAAVGAAFLPTAIAQFVPAPTDLKTVAGQYPVRYKEVPQGICETTPNVTSYSGYVDVSPNQHIFFWFFEARNVDPTTAPLTIWLNGGPGDPSMVGLFSDNGPCWVDYDGNLQYNEYSWNNVSNMIYIDQPTQVGLSYAGPINGYVDPDSGFTVTVPGDTCPDYAPADSCGTFSNGNASLTANSTTAAAPNVWMTLQGLMTAFPQYAREGVHLSTESYGGHYGPVFAEYFETQNSAKIAGAHSISLLSLSVGNGWFDPRIQYPAYYNYTVSPGNSYNYKPYDTATAEQVYNLFWGTGNCIDKLNDCNTRQIDEVCSDADNFCYAVESIFDTITGRDEYDIRELSPDPFPYTNFVAYLNTPKVQQAIGAFTNFSYSVTNLGAGTTATAFGTTGDDARELGIIADCQKLLKQGVSILMYHGDADYNCNWLGGAEVAAEINATGWSGAGYQNISTPDDVVHGVVKQAGNYSFVRVYDAGHSVPFYKPLAALTMFERMLKNTDIATGTKAVTAAYRSTGPAKSTYVEGNSTIQLDVVDASCTYDTVTDVPDCSNGTSADTDSRKIKERKRR
ncbi:hypothetical protein LTR36_009471 [Oleoguttula mirabilis]|uniref:Carboxypeptidase n=1 Tax=Oleoguttula mirabilis TaxID=1507867 RepID=A0AAV9JU11_9PEZI|nr:hypothetical protein LTR36_009471 [Oleoguttula mirabilis]